MGVIRSLRIYNLFCYFITIKYCHYGYHEPRKDTLSFRRPRSGYVKTPNIRQYSTFSKSYDYNLKTPLRGGSGARSNSYYLNPYYITGFVDAEGCFTTSDSRMSLKWQVKPIFKITLHNKDRKILEALQITWGCR